MSRTIRVDNEVYAWLQRQARPFEDSPNSVLRRVAGLDRAQDGRTAQTIAQQAPLQGARAMAKRRADEAERKPVREKVEEVHQVKLKRRRPRWSKVWEDGSRHIYWIFVGYKNFHGVSEDEIADARTTDANGKFIFGACMGTAIKIFEASLTELLANVDTFRTDSKGDRKFDLEWRNGRPFIKQAPNLRLEFLAQIELTRPASVAPIERLRSPR